MPSSSVRAFTDPDEYAAAIRQSTYKITITRRGNYSAKLTRIDLPSLWMQRFSDNLPRIASIDIPDDRAIIAFLTQPGSSVVHDGVQYRADKIARPGLEQTSYQQSSGPTQYASMSLPVEQMAALGPAVLGRDVMPAKNEAVFTPPPDAMARLQRLHATAGQLAEGAPAVLTHPEAARGLEQALVEAMMHCLSGGELHEERSAQRHHAAIMRRFEQTIQKNLDQPLYIPELCREVGTSLRTLNDCCQEHLGMGPKHYLLLRRMHMVRRALRESLPAEMTVTEIATRYGFWQFGRLSVEYKALFGETPSTTLARPL